MEHKHENSHETAHSAAKSATTPKDFFLWVGATVTLYGSITAFFTLIFTYINIAFPDPLAYSGDLYDSSVRTAMATIMVLIPIMLGCLLAIRRDIVRTPGKANIWVRRWALTLTIFLASATAAITLITLLTTFLGGELTTRFALKALIVLLLAVLNALHFLADFKGYWTLHRKNVNLVGAAVGALAVMTVAAGFFIIGTPKEMRAQRSDQQRVSDLQTIQYEVTNYWQQKRTLPKDLSVLVDPLTSTTVPTDPESGAAYEYKVEGTNSFSLCANFSANSRDTSGQGNYGEDMSRASYGGGMDTSFMHGTGRTCFTRTIDRDKFPFTPADAASPKGL